MNPEVLEHRNRFTSILVRDLPADRKKQIKDNVVEQINLLMSFGGQSSSFFFFFFLFLMAVLGLLCCAQAFPSWSA